MRERHGFRQPETPRYSLRDKCARQHFNANLPTLFAIWAAAARTVVTGEPVHCHTHDSREHEEQETAAEPAPHTTGDPPEPRDPVFGNWGGPLSPIEVIIDKELKEKLPKVYEWIMARARQRLTPSPDTPG